MKTLRFVTDIDAWPEDVWYMAFTTETYREWTAACGPGSHFVGEWETGARMRFLAPSGDGMLAEIVEAQPYAQMSIKLIGEIRGGVEAADDATVSESAPAFEHYSLIGVDDGTELTVEADVPPEHEAWAAATWPKALDRLKQIAETYAAKQQPWRRDHPPGKRPPRPFTS